MNFSDFVGTVSNRLREEMNASRLVHAYLFTGPAGTGKRSLANSCARALLCESPSGRPCDVCPACRRALMGNHPDVRALEPGGRGNQIRIDSIREAISWLEDRPFEARRRVLILCGADKMNPAAQNALLKTLEEPPGDDVIIMTTDKASDLLPTIVSRCRIIRFPLLSEEDAVKALINHGLTPTKARLYSRLSMGSIGDALALSGDVSFSARREQVLNALRALRAPQDVTLAALPLSGVGKESVEGVLNILELCARDIMAIQDVDGRVVQTDIEAQLRQLNIRGSAMLRGVFEARRMFRSNVSWQYVLETLFFQITGGSEWQP